MWLHGPRGTMRLQQLECSLLKTARRPPALCARSSSARWRAFGGLPDCAWVCQPQKKGQRAHPWQHRVREEAEAPQWGSRSRGSGRRRGTSSHKATMVLPSARAPSANGGVGRLAHVVVAAPALVVEDIAPAPAAIAGRFRDDADLVSSGVAQLSSSCCCPGNHGTRPSTGSRLAEDFEATDQGHFHRQSGCGGSFVDVCLYEEGLRVRAAAAERLHRVCGDCSLRLPQLGMALVRTAVRLAKVRRPRQALHSVRSLGRCSGRHAGRWVRRVVHGLEVAARKVGTTPARRGHAELDSLGDVPGQGGDWRRGGRRLCGPRVAPSDHLSRSALLGGRCSHGQARPGLSLLEDVVIANEMTVLHEVVHFASVPAAFAAPALAVRSACASGFRHRISPCRFAASAPVVDCVGSCSDPARVPGVGSSTPALAVTAALAPELLQRSQQVRQWWSTSPAPAVISARATGVELVTPAPTFSFSAFAARAPLVEHIVPALAVIPARAPGRSWSHQLLRSFSDRSTCAVVEFIARAPCSRLVRQWWSTSHQLLQ